MLYDDLFEMFDAILDYVSKHPGCEVICADDPFARRIGFATRVPEETWLTRFRHRPWIKFGLLGRLVPHLKPKRELRDTWEISLVKVKDSLAKEGVTEEVRTIVRETFKTPMGRVSMAQALERGKSPVATS
jgi:hypothetical protein